MKIDILYSKFTKLIFLKTAGIKLFIFASFSSEFGNFVITLIKLVFPVHLALEIIKKNIVHIQSEMVVPLLNN